jgi:hypothetical protein
VSQQAIATLFDREKDPINLIKIKELLECPGARDRQGGRCRQRVGNRRLEEHMKLNRSPKQENW